MTEIVEVIVGGVESSGSTAVWQAVCAFACGTPRKCHGYFDMPNAVKLLCIRDFRDVLASLIRRKIFGEYDDINKYAIQCWNYLKQSVSGTARYIGDDLSLFIKYEKWVGNERKLVDMLIRQLKARVGEQEADLISRNITSEKNAIRASQFLDHSEYDPKTNIHGNHITCGKVGSWTLIFDQFDDETREFLLQEIDPWLKIFDYE